MKLNIKSRFLLTLTGLLIGGCAAQSAPQSTATAERQRSRLQVAEAMFQERCKTAGEKIYRIVDNVDGIFLMKTRPKKGNFDDQFELSDPYGHDIGGKGYIETFLLPRNAKGSLTYKDPVKNGYHYVEAFDPEDGIRYRYTGAKKAVGRMDANAPNVKIDLARDPSFDLNIYEFVIDRMPALGSSPRYGVTYEDISTHQDREYWIAGGKIKVIDLQTNEAIAERIGYMMDRGQGNTSGGRSPWLLAERHACPSFPTTPGGQPFKMRTTRNFVEQVLRIKQGN
jgi:hypothetical protein